jgi:hypothetical protein
MTHPPTTLQGIASGLSIMGIGTVEYRSTADDSKEIAITLDNVLFVPDCPNRPLCPRHIAEHSGGPADVFTALRDHGILTIKGKAITVPYQKSSGLPYIFSAPGITSYNTFLSHQHSHSSGVSLNGNLSPMQHVKLLLHESCNHVNILNHWI